MRLYGVIVILLTALLCWVSCERDLSTKSIEQETEPPQNEPEPFKCDRDGVVNLKFARNSWSQTDSIPFPTIEAQLDSFQIYEKEHEILVPNAIKFQVDAGQALTFFFTGNFIGMETAVVIVSRWYNTEKEEHYWESEAIYLRHNHGTSFFAPAGAELEPSECFVFCIDTDLDNHGCGELIVSQSSEEDTIKVDAAKNTVIYKTSAVHNIAIPDLNEWENTYLYFRMAQGDVCSFIDNKNCAVIIYRDMENPFKVLRLADNARGSGFYVPYTPINLQIEAFVPKFTLE